MRGLFRAYPWVPAALALLVVLCWYGDPSGPGRIIGDLASWLSPASVAQGVTRLIPGLIPGGGNG